MLYSASRCHHPIHGILYPEISLNLEFEFCKTVIFFLTHAQWWGIQEDAPSQWKIQEEEAFHRGTWYLALDMIGLRTSSLSEQGYVCPVGLPRELLKIRHDQDHFNYLWIFLKAHFLAPTPIKTLLLEHFSLSFPCFLALNMIPKWSIPRQHIV